MTSADKSTDEDLDSSDFLALGDLLRRLKGEDMASYEAAVRARGLKTRHASYLVEIAGAFETLPQARERVLAVGWTKTSVIAPHVTDDNVDRLLELASNYPVHRLKEMVTGDGPGEAKRVFNIYLTDEEHALVAEQLVGSGAVIKEGKLHGVRVALVAAMRELGDRRSGRKD